LIASTFGIPYGRFIQSRGYYMYICYINRFCNFPLNFPDLPDMSHSQWGVIHPPINHPQSHSRKLIGYTLPLHLPLLDFPPSIGQNLLCTYLRDQQYLLAKSHKLSLAYKITQEKEVYF
jgi:hypothetical protein